MVAMMERIRGGNVHLKKASVGTECHVEMTLVQINFSSLQPKVPPKTEKKGVMSEMASLLVSDS